MMILFWACVGFIVNCLVGAIVWSSIDFEDGRYFKWYCSAPYPIIVQPLVVTCWPIGLYFHLRRNKWTTTTE